MKVLTIAGVNLRRFIRDRANLFFVFALPLAIILLVGSQFGGGRDTRIGLDLPASAGQVAAALEAALADTPDLATVRFDDRAALERGVALGAVEAGVSLPADTAARLAAGEDVVADLVMPRGALTGPMEALLGEALARATAEEAAIRFAVAEGADRAAAAEAAAAIAPTLTEIAVNTGSVGRSLFAGLSNRFELGATGQLILFMFLTGLTGSADLIQSRRFGVTRRMLASPTAPLTIIAGEALGRFGVVLVQGLYIIAASALLFGIDWGDPLAAAVLVAVFGLCGTGGAMLLGTLFKRDETATMIGIIAGIGLGALGGCMVPLEILGPTMQTVSRFTPHGWANEAFAILLRRDGTVLDILPQLGAIALFAAALLGLAAWRMAASLRQP